MNIRRLLTTAAILALSAGMLFLTLKRRAVPPLDKSNPSSARAGSSKRTEVAKPSPKGLAVPTPEISESVRVVLAESPYLQRKRAILALGKNLSLADCEALCNFLRAPIPAEEETVSAALKNSVMEQMRGQRQLAGTWHQTLIGLAEDVRMHEVIRDYAFQHMVDWYEEVLRDESFKLAREDMRKALWSALDQTTAAISGTALLSLYHLSAQEPLIEPAGVRSAALKLMSRESAPEGSKITALQVCGQMRVAEALPTARDWAQSGGSISLRAAAIAALGLMGETSDLKLLAEIGPDAATGALNSAVTAAMKKLAERNKG